MPIVAMLSLAQFLVNWARFLLGVLKMPFALARIKKLL